MKKATIPEEKRSLSHGDIVTVPLAQYKGEARADSRVLAAQLGNQHENTYDLIKRYEADFRQLGVLRFETGKPSAGLQGGRPEAYALLNEDQSYLLLTYSRNTPKVRALKISLVKAFCETRYGNACQTLEAAKKEASQSGSRLAHWRHKKPGLHQHVAHLREQLQLTLGLEDVRP
ncbi:Rha family transcriptional regulator [Pseudomonas sp. Irchel s3a18]|uniref:Rha family transcriptional regulator n=1 Tax=Pseudomonas sp. Irchel s3a18 TaxID=2009053 RepID=UPI000BA3FE8F|nr:Rha family transcriptional regulator [Pseudomonas sp. Irchel s3a18]